MGSNLLDELRKANMILFLENHVVHLIRSRRALLIKQVCSFLILVTTILMLNSLHTTLAFALSPSFSIQEVNTGVHNGIQINGITHAETKPNYNWPLASSSDIQRVTYFSDGRTLNATLW